ncbi:MAG: nitrogenase molybdenum-iron protein subunit beta [Thermodesulfobacteriota bacterium]
MALLRHTPAEITVDRQALSINPAKTCQPVGAMYAALGIHGCLPHSHGSQGCCAYHRSALTRHTKEPIAAATSSFTEGSSVFGGQANLLTAIQNIFSVYEPEIIAVHTTCLSETIGDDMTQIVEKARGEGKVPAGKHVIYCNTPSYVGSHVTGYSNMVTGMVKNLAESTGTPSGKVNVIPGFCEPADMAEIKRLAEMMGAPINLFPDTSGVLNAPLTGKYEMYPAGGARVADIKASGDASASIALGHWGASQAAKWLDAEKKVPCTILGLPFGLEDTDAFVMALSKLTGKAVPASIDFERGQVVDVISDYHQYFHGKRVALAGDPDQLIGLTRLLVELDMIPAYLVSGTPGNKFERTIREIVKGTPAEGVTKVKCPGDMFILHQWIKQEPVDLLIGNTYLKYIARDEDIPHIRHGFPILDRMGHTFFPTVGYKGALRLIEKMLDAMLTKRDRDASEIEFELVY